MGGGIYSLRSTTELRFECNDCVESRVRIATTFLENAGSATFGSRLDEEFVDDALFLRDELCCLLRAMLSITLSSLLEPLPVFGIDFEDEA